MTAANYTAEPCRRTGLAPRWKVVSVAGLVVAWANDEVAAGRIAAALNGAPAAGASQAIDAGSDSEYLRELAALLQAHGLGDAALPLPGIAAHYEELRAGAAAQGEAVDGLPCSVDEALLVVNDAANAARRRGDYAIANALVRARVILFRGITTPPAASAVAVDEARMKVAMQAFWQSVEESGCTPPSWPLARDTLTPRWVRAALTAAIGSAGGVEGAP